MASLAVDFLLRRSGGVGDGQLMMFLREMKLYGVYRKPGVC